MDLSSLHPQHRQELLQGSGIHPQLAELNFCSLRGTEAYQYLFISPEIPRTNAGQITQGWLRRYQHLEGGGWWCAGLDPIQQWQAMEWGCFKPNAPRENRKGKKIKYEHPPATSTRLFCLRVTPKIWQKIADRYQLPLPEDLNPSEEGEALGFWDWVMAQEVPIILCEGVKKAAALLSIGYVAIGLPGIHSGYRTHRSPQGQITHRQLIGDLEYLLQKPRPIYICFDYETQPKKVKAIQYAVNHLGELLIAQGCSVQMIQLPGPEKGVDDWIVQQGDAAFDRLYQESRDLDNAGIKGGKTSALTYPINLHLQQRYLGKIAFPETGIIGIKSPKGSGKTTALVQLVKTAKVKNQPILLLTHRIQLGRFLCDKIGISWIDDRPQGHSLGLCIDSLWKLNPQAWRGGILILDEVEQSLWHLLNSNTCKDKRVKLLKSFQQFVSVILESGGLIVAQDADLSDLSLDYLTNLSEIKPKPWIVCNQWQPHHQSTVTFFDSPNPSSLIHQLEQDLIAGKKCYITTDSRSGRYSCETIEKYIKQRLAHLLHRHPKTLIVSSQTTHTPGHAAADFITGINQKVQDYDAVFVTPSLGTGVSIDVQHFDAVYGIFQGVISDSEARQALARVRSQVPRYIWCAKRGIGVIGCGSKNYRILAHWYQDNQKENLALMKPLYPVDVDLPVVYDPIHLRTWAKFAARINDSMDYYRQAMLEGLKSEEFEVEIYNDSEPTELLKELRQAFLAASPEQFQQRKALMQQIFQLQRESSHRSKNSQTIQDQIRKIREQIQWHSALAVVNAPNLSAFEYEHLLSQRALTELERNCLHKYVLQQRYGIEITPELKLKDDRGYYGAILTHYYLIHEAEYFRLRDKQEWNDQLQRGEGQVFLPDLKTYTLKVEALQSLGLRQFLDPQRQWQEGDLEIGELTKKAIACSQHIKRAVGVQLPATHSANLGIKILNRLLGVLGLKLKRIKTESGFVYTLNPKYLQDERQQIFTVWKQWDALSLATLSRMKFLLLESNNAIVQSPRQGHSRECISV